MDYILGPCQLEENSVEVAEFLQSYMSSKHYSFDDWFFKASFDKANRSSVNGKRGLGLDESMKVFGQIKEAFPGIRILTDVHNLDQIQRLNFRNFNRITAGRSKLVDAIQIPAFLCRQTDLIEAAVSYFDVVNIKKGQFLSPAEVQNIVDKAVHFRKECYYNDMPLDLRITERGTTFGYNNLVVDMRGFREMAENFKHEDCLLDGKPKIVFDGTHSAQKPGGDGSSSGGNRNDVPSLVRAAVATGYVDTVFLEVHPDPENAPSDGPNSLTYPMLKNLVPQIDFIGNSANQMVEGSY